jgi:capsular polysaccharide export protein
MVSHRYLTFSSNLLNLGNLETFLNGKVVKRKVFSFDPSPLHGVIGWGRTLLAQRAQWFSKRQNLPFITLEEGFLQSIGMGTRQIAPFSLIMDEVGIYYDASQPSALENILNSQGWQTQEILDEAKELLALMKRHQGLDSCLDPSLEMERSKTESPKNELKVLLIDQSRQDPSVRCGMADENTFSHLVRTALEENPGAAFYIYPAKGGAGDLKNGYLKHFVDLNRCKVLSPDIEPLALMAGFHRVYTVTSALGLEALIMGCEVHCFGLPFYAGWGLTQDRMTCPRRHQTLSVLELFAAAYLRYPSYVNALTGKPCTAQEALETVSYLKKLDQKNQGKIYCFGFAPLMQDWIRRYLYSKNNTLYFVNSAQEALKKGIDGDSKIFVWGHKMKSEWGNKVIPDLVPLAENLGLPIGRIEEGFIRSIGLGSDLCKPHSLAVDYRGIYYDPSVESDLEHLLENTQFSEEVLQQGRLLQEKIVAHKLTKYNIGLTKPLDFHIPPGKTVILVPGQVKGDASIDRGGMQIKCNLTLLQTVREKNPEAFIMYKPHPDVVAANRPGAHPEEVLLQYCDEMITDICMAQLLDGCDEVHTMTSLTGFEALIRNKKVVTYGVPFYAGWGLTTDFAEIPPRRSRRLTLDELFAGAVILYPRYYNWELSSLDTPANTVDRFIEALENHPGENARGLVKSASKSASSALPNKAQDRAIVKGPLFQLNRRLFQLGRFLRSFYQPVAFYLSEKFNPKKHSDSLLFEL